MFSNRVLFEMDNICTGVLFDHQKSYSVDHGTYTAFWNRGYSKEGNCVRLSPITGSNPNLY